MRLFRQTIATALTAAATLVIAGPAHAAPASTVEITSPADGSIGYGTDLTISGRARSATSWVYVTIGNDINVYEAYLYKGRWSTHVNEQPAGPTTICAETRDAAGTVTARDCNAFTVTADPSRLQITYPEEGATYGDRVWVAVSCVSGTTVRLTMDAGETVSLPCDYWGVDRTYTGLAEGSHTVTASMVDQGVVVATQTRTFTIDLPDPGTVSISAPADGSSGYVGPVTISGTASSWNGGVYLSTDGVETHITSIDQTGQWTVTVDDLSVGAHTICAAVKDTNFQVEAQDCITYTVDIDPSLLVITSPEQGSTQPPYYILVEGYCADGTTVRISLDADPPAEQPCNGMFRQEYYGLADGAHTVTVTMLYAETAIATRERSFTVDATPPAAPIVTSPSTGTTITAPTLPLVGTAEPRSTIEVLTADEMASWSTVAGDDGSWMLTLDATFFELSGALTGRRTTVTVKVAAIDAYGNRSPTSAYTYTVRIR
jgi:large repetitive protein